MPEEQVESSGESLRQATCDARLARVDIRHAATCAMHHALALYVLCASLVRSAANSRLPTMNALILLFVSCIQVVNQMRPDALRLLAP